MLEAVVEFGPATPLRAEVCGIRRTSLHTHPQALEIVYVLQGELHAKVSCENFDLQVGDFVVINRDDPHQLRGSTDNVTAVLHVDLAAFRDVDPLIEYIVFACESFDLARFRRQEELLRGLLLDLVASLVADSGESDGGAKELANEFMKLVCRGYSLESYYNRTATLSRSHHDKFRSIVRQLWLHATERNVLDVISDHEHFSKSYVSHIVKDVAAVSFNDLLAYFRVARAEKLLLTSDATMIEIAARSGFSDAKYFTRSFVNWFHESPADYRKHHRPDVSRDHALDPVADTTVRELIRDHRRLVASRGEGPRLSVTPLLLKNLGARRDMFDVAEAVPPAPTETHGETSCSVPHLIPIRVTEEDLDAGYLLDGLASFDQIATKPCLVLEYSTRDLAMAMVTKVAERLARQPAPAPTIWLVYGSSHDRAGVDHVVARALEDRGLMLQPILTP